LHDPLEHDSLVLGEPLHGVGGRGIVGTPFREANPSAREERVDSLEPRLAVQPCPIVVVPVERDERPAGFPGETQQERVEHVGPGERMHDRAVREHSVEVEQACACRRGEPEHPCRHRHAQQPRRGAHVFETREATERDCHFDSLLDVAPVAGCRMRADRRSGGQVRGALRAVERQLPVRRDDVEIR
jgi:hypothetical protein